MLVRNPTRLLLDYPTEGMVGYDRAGITDRLQVSSLTCTPGSFMSSPGENYYRITGAPEYESKASSLRGSNRRPASGQGASMICAGWDCPQGGTSGLPQRDPNPAMMGTHQSLLLVSSRAFLETHDHPAA